MVPVIRSLQQAWPETQITWIIGRTESVLLGDLDGVEFITFDKRAGAAGRRAVAEALSQRRFDALLLMQVALRAGWLSRVVRADQRIGFDSQRSRDFHGLFVNRRIAPHPRAHVMDGFFDFINALGVTERVLRWDIPVPEAARQRADDLVPPDQPTMVISPCSSQRVANFRNWSIASYVELVRHAHNRHGLQVIITGGPTAEERRYGESIAREAGVPVENLVGRTTLKELLAILGRAEVVVSPDSGPAHMAVAAGTPVIGLYATSNPDRTGPYLGRRWVVNRYPDAVKAHWGKSVDQVAWGRRVRRADAMDLITVADVTGRLDALMATPGAERLQERISP